MRSFNENDNEYLKKKKINDERKPDSLKTSWRSSGIYYFKERIFQNGGQSHSIGIQQHRMRNGFMTRGMTGN